MVSFLRMFLLFLSFFLAFDVTIAQNSIEPTIFMYINDSAILECRAIANVRPALRYQRVQTKQEANLELLILEGKTVPAGKSYVLVYKQIPPTNQYINPTDIILTGATVLERCGQLNQRINESSWLVANSPHHTFPMPQVIRGTMSRADDGWRNLPPPPPPRRASPALPNTNTTPNTTPTNSNWRTRTTNPPPNNTPIVLPNPVNPSVNPNTNPPNQQNPLVLPNPVNANRDPNIRPPNPVPNLTPSDSTRRVNTSPSTSADTRRRWRDQPNPTVFPTQPTTNPNQTPPTAVLPSQSPAQTTSSPDNPTQQTNPPPVANLTFGDKLSIFTECTPPDGNISVETSPCGIVNRTLPNVNQFLIGSFDTALSSGLADVSVRILPEVSNQETQYTIVVNGQQNFTGYDTLYVALLPLNISEGQMFEELSKALTSFTTYYNAVKAKLIAENQAFLATQTNTNTLGVNQNISTGTVSTNIQERDAAQAKKWKNWGFVTNLSGSYNTGYGKNVSATHGLLGTNIGTKWIHIAGYTFDYMDNRFSQIFYLRDDNGAIIDTVTTETFNTNREFKMGYLLGHVLTDKITLAGLNSFQTRSSMSSSPSFQPLKIKNETLLGLEIAPQTQGQGTPDFRVRYLFGGIYTAYNDTTFAAYIPGSLKKEQFPLYHELSILFNYFTNKWSANLNFTGSNYFDHYTEPRIMGNATMSYRFTQSFSINFSTNINYSPNTQRENQPNNLTNNAQVGMRMGFTYSFGARTNSFLRIFQNALPQYANSF